VADPIRKKRATYDDVVAAPPSKVAEIVDGELYLSPRPAGPHTRVATLLGVDLGGPFDRDPGGTDAPGGWILLDEPELHFGEQIVVPDLAGWRRTRMPKVPNEPFFTLAPDWVCEVISPSSQRLDRVKKMGIYARERIPHAWLIDPLARTLEVFRLDGPSWRVVGSYDSDASVRAEPFDAIELEMKRWWID
jgi:Uma2 family endonuclease